MMSELNELDTKNEMLEHASRMLLQALEENNELRKRLLAAEDNILTYSKWKEELAADQDQRDAFMKKEIELFERMVRYLESIEYSARTK